MSANGKAGIKGISKSDEFIVTFKKNQDSTYTKETKKMTRNRTTGGVKYYRKNNPVIEEGPYRLVDCGTEYDEKMEFIEFPSHETICLYFKKFKPPNDAETE